MQIAIILILAFDVAPATEVVVASMLGVGAVLHDERKGIDTASVEHWLVAVGAQQSHYFAKYLLAVMSHHRSSRSAFDFDSLNVITSMAKCDRSSSAAIAPC